MKTAVFFRLSLGMTGLVVSSAFGAPIDCIDGNHTATAVDRWRESAVTALTSGNIDENALARNIKRCFQNEVPVCLKRLADYTTRLDLAGPSEDENVSRGSHKRPPNEILAPGERNEFIIPTDIEETAARNGWPAVRYKSRHSGGFDSDTSSLLMIYVPGDRVNPPVNYDRWLNFALPADTGNQVMNPIPQKDIPDESDYRRERNGDASLPKIFTMVTLTRRQGDHPGEVYFQRFRRDEAGDPNFRPMANDDMSSCVRCHPNGLRAISPLGYHVREDERQMPEEQWRAVTTINEAMESAAGYQPISWRTANVGGVEKPFLKTASYGPIIGPMVPLNGRSRTEEFIMGTRENPGCYKDRTEIDVTDIFSRPVGRNNIYRLSRQPSIRWTKVRDAMQCAKCHNDQDRASLNTLLSTNQMDFKILVDQSMPMGSHSNPLDNGTASSPVVDDLTGDERIALSNCLIAEFALEEQELGKWLKQGACGRQ